MSPPNCSTCNKSQGKTAEDLEMLPEEAMGQKVAETHCKCPCSDDKESSSWKDTLTSNRSIFAITYDYHIGSQDKQSFEYQLKQYKLSAELKFMQHKIKNRRQEEVEKPFKNVLREIESFVKTFVDDLKIKNLAMVYRSTLQSFGSNFNYQLPSSDDSDEGYMLTGAQNEDLNNTEKYAVEYYKLDGQDRTALDSCNNVEILEESKSVRDDDK